MDSSRPGSFFFGVEAELYCWPLTSCFYSGCVPEKFNAVESSSNIDAEYGNQGTDFTLIPREGFGWLVAIFPLSHCTWLTKSLAYRTNASYQLGLEVITQFQRRALGALTPPDSFFYGPRKGQPAP